MGVQRGGSITACYTVGHSLVHGVSADGNSGNDVVGSLVGLQEQGGITACYSIANARGGKPNGPYLGNDVVGGLVGYQFIGGTITASYSTGTVFGEQGNDAVGSIVGINVGNNVVDSYGFGLTFDGDGSGGTNGNPPVDRATLLTVDNVGEIWTDATFPVNAWQLGTGVSPKLLYSDYDGINTNYHCADDWENAPVGAILILNCDSLIPGQ